MLHVVTAETFTPHVGSTFTIELDAATAFPIVLVSVAAINEQAAQGSVQQRTSFSLLFRASPTPILPQHIYHIVHETLGALDIFLVPIGPDHQGMQYEAIFT